VAIVKKVRVALSAGTSKTAPSVARGKLGGDGDGDGVKVIGVGRLIEADQLVSIWKSLEIW
jgi:hypothetical protein